METLTFSTACLELRNTGDGRTVRGLAAPFGVSVPVGSYSEQIQHGAFTKTINGRVEKIKLLAQHDETKAVGRLTLAREQSDGLYIEARISNTAPGNDLLELVKDGVLDSFSIGYLPISSSWSTDRKTVLRTEVKLLEVSIVTFAAFPQALITELRNQNEDPVQPYAHPLAWATHF